MQEPMSCLCLQARTVPQNQCSPADCHCLAASRAVATPGASILARLCYSLPCLLQHSLRLPCTFGTPLPALELAPARITYGFTFLRRLRHLCRIRQNSDQQLFQGPALKAAAAFSRATWPHGCPTLRASCRKSNYATGWQLWKTKSILENRDMSRFLATATAPLLCSFNHQLLPGFKYGLEGQHMQLSG
jgi:hypothetical protein